MAGRKRIDPAVRPADGRTGYDRVAGKDAGRHYVLTNPNDEATGTDHYVQELGYEVEKVRPNGPVTGASRRAQDGAPVTSGGLVLVSCPMEEWEARSNDGQERVTQMEKRILRDDALQDGLRGRGWDMKARLERDFGGSGQVIEEA